jgi:tripartite-type tricarboxylate transporter receptor subunit TctC
MPPEASIPASGRKIMKYLLRTTASVAAFAVTLAGPAYAQGYYDGKTMTYIIATSPGGGYDAYGRLIGSYLGDELGAEKVIFQNLPGAGHIIGANTLYAAEPDGLTIGTFNTGLIYAQILQQDGAQFDLNAFSWIGKASSDSRAMVLSNASGLSSFEDLVALDETVLFAASGVGSANYTETKLLADALGLNIRMIPGYNGNEGEMAMMRGEVVGQVATYESLGNFVKSGEGFYALAIGGDHEPQAIDYAKNDRARGIISLIDANSNLGRLTAAPPGLAPEVLEELRDAYMTVLTDPAFLEDAARLSLQIDPARGDAVALQVQAALQQSPETVEIISNALDVEVPTILVSTSIMALGDGGKEVTFMSGDAEVTGAVSGSRTALTINGADATRDQLAVGMNCDMEYNPTSEDNEFVAVSCSGEVAAAEEASATTMATSAIMGLADGGKEVTFMSGGVEVVGSVSGSRTMLTIDGVESDRDGLSVGMNCEMEYDPTDDNEFKTLACTN